VARIFLAILENYQGLPDGTIQTVRGAEDKWVLTLSWTPLRITGTGDHYSVERRLVYPQRCRDDIHGRPSTRRFLPPIP
jgi:hypothetical protein